MGKYLITFVLLLTSAVAAANNLSNPLGLTFPIRGVMQLGHFEDRAIESPEVLQEIKGGPVIFVIGNDEVSLAWVIKNKEYLAKKNAKGLLVSADQLSDVKTVREKTGYRRIFLMFKDAEIANTFDIWHYPVLIDPNESWMSQ